MVYADACGESRHREDARQVVVALSVENPPGRNTLDWPRFGPLLDCFLSSWQSDIGPVRTLDLLLEEGILCDFLLPNVLHDFNAESATTLYSFTGKLVYGAQEADYFKQWPVPLKIPCCFNVPYLL